MNCKVLRNEIRDLEGNRMELPVFSFVDIWSENKDSITKNNSLPEKNVTRLENMFDWCTSILLADGEV